MAARQADLRGQQARRDALGPAGFLLLRVREEREETLRVRPGGRWRQQSTGQVMPEPPWTPPRGGRWDDAAVLDVHRRGASLDDDRALSKHIARNSPGRVLTDLTVKEILARNHSGDALWCGWSHDGNTTHDDVEVHDTIQCDTLRWLLKPYSEHPAFNKAWLLCVHGSDGTWNVGGDFAPCHCCGGPVSLLLPRPELFWCERCLGR
jgi:hypothetical protein